MLSWGIQTVIYEQRSCVISANPVPRSGRGTPQAGVHWLEWGGEPWRDKAERQRSRSPVRGEPTGIKEFTK